MLVFEKMRRVRFSAVIICSLLFIAPSVYSSSIEQISFDELCDKAEVIFEGLVTNVSVVKDSRGNIWTQVSFKVSDVIKGSGVGNTLNLKFLGGTIGDTTLEITDLAIPALNERGIYFIESLSENLANPLLGWSQGHYLIKMDTSGTARVQMQEADAGQSSTQSAQVTSVQVPAGDTGQPSRLSTQAVADAAVADAADTPVTEALSVTDFKTMIRQRLN